MVHHRGRTALHKISSRVPDLFDDVGLHQVSAVDRRAGGVQKLQRRHRHRLAEADAGDVHPLDPRLVDQDAGALAGDVHARHRSQAERLQIPVKALDAQPQPQLHEHRVAGVLDGLGQILRAVAAAVAADAPAVHHHRARTEEMVFQSGHAGVQRGGKGDDLEGRTGLVGVGDDAVAQKLVERFHVMPRRVVEVEIRL